MSVCEERLGAVLASLSNDDSPLRKRPTFLERSPAFFHIRSPATASPLSSSFIPHLTLFLHTDYTQCIFQRYAHQLTPFFPCRSDDQFAIQVQLVQPHGQH